MVKWILYNLGTCSLDETKDAFLHYHVGVILVDVRNLPDGKLKTKEERHRLKTHLVAIAYLRKRGYKVVIRCHAGVSRSNGIAMGILMLQHDMNYEDARKIVKHFVPQTNTHPDFIDDIKKAVEELKDTIQWKI